MGRHTRKKTRKQKKVFNLDTRLFAKLGISMDEKAAEKLYKECEYVRNLMKHTGDYE